MSKTPDRRISAGRILALMIFVFLPGVTCAEEKRVSEQYQKIVRAFAPPGAKCQLYIDPEYVYSGSKDGDEPVINCSGAKTGAGSDRSFILDLTPTNVFELRIPRADAPVYAMKTVNFFRFLKADRFIPFVKECFEKYVKSDFSDNDRLSKIFRGVRGGDMICIFKDGYILFSTSDFLPF